MKTILKYIKTYIILILVFFILLLLACLIPKKYIKENVKESLGIFIKEKNLYMLNLKIKNVKLDNFSDSLIINTAYSVDNSHPIKSMLTARKNYISGKTKIIYLDAKGELKSSSKYSSINQIGDLIDTVNETVEESFEYARYWHGYLVFLRPMLVFFSYIQIRIVLTGTLTILLRNIIIFII